MFTEKKHIRGVALRSKRCRSVGKSFYSPGACYDNGDSYPEPTPNEYFSWEEYNSVKITDYHPKGKCGELEEILDPVIPPEIEGQEVMIIT